MSSRAEMAEQGQGCWQACAPSRRPGHQAIKATKQDCPSVVVLPALRSVTFTPHTP